MKKILALTMITVVLLSTLSMFTTEAEGQETQYWAVIVCGGLLGTTFSRNTDYLYHTLTLDYNFDHISYIKNSTKDQVRSAINSTLFKQSDENDIIFIYITGHGAGLWCNSVTPPRYHYNFTGIRYDDPSINETGEYFDEGNEIRESSLVPPYDFTGDNDTDDWVGFDESMEIARMEGEEMYVEHYYDDELASDLNRLTGKYKTLVFVRQGCMGGGLIDDISGSGRVIITATNETYTSVGDTDGDGFSEWSEAFIDALHGQDTYWDNGIIDTGMLVDADANYDGTVSMLEAWEYAWDHDDARLSGYETPWLDDNGDGYPTFENESDVFAPGDGVPNGLAANTWLRPPIINCHDRGNVNFPGSYYHWNYTELGYGIDLQVDWTDLDLLSLAFGTFVWEPWGIGENLYNPDANLNGDELVDGRDIALAAMHFGTSCEEYWDGYKYERKTVGGTVVETIDFYNRTDFTVPLGQEIYEDGEQVSDTYLASDWNPRYAFPISNATKGQKFTEEGWFYFAWLDPPES